MKVGVCMFVTDQSMDPVRLGEALEERGFESLWLPEHSHIPVSRETPWGGREGAPPLPEYYARTLDIFVALGAIAATTDRLRLGSGIALVAQRDPIWTAKQVATLDVLSGGRVEVGVGYGWNKEEMRHHGVDYGQRRRLLAEKIAVMKALWTQDEAAFAGEMVRLEPSWSWPKPIQQPHPPIVLGGAAGPRTFAAMAEFCDGWMPIIGRSDVEGTVSDLRRALERAGRDPDSFHLTAWGADPDPGHWPRWEALGFERVLLLVPPAPAEVVIPLLDEYQALLDL